MASEIREKPLPTPHPDQPRTPPAEGERERKGGREPEKAPAFDPDEMVFDSCVDDLDLKLSGPAFDPDPALHSNDPGGGERKLDPATAELFEGVRHGSGELTRPRTGWAKRLLSRLKGGARRSRASSTGSRTSGDAIPAPHRTGEIRRVDAGSDDDESGGDVRGIWMTLLLLSYSSAVTLGLGWVLWTGRSIHPPEERAQAESPRAEDPRAARSLDSTAKVELPPIPSANLASIGQTIRIGDLEITPLSVSFARAELERKIEPADYRLEDLSSLVLRFKVTNVSRDTAFRPLARSLIRDAASALDRSFVSTQDGTRIELYPLAIESEWLIVGQEFPQLKPDESAETLVTSEPVTEDRLRDEMTWRIRLRTGPYRSDIFAVRFRRSELNP
jgi:hypothetical protein